MSENSRKDRASESHLHAQTPRREFVRVKYQDAKGDLAVRACRPASILWHFIPFDALLRPSASARAKRFLTAALAFATFGLQTACSVYPVAQDPDGLALRRNANEVLMALQAWHHDKGGYPDRLVLLVPTYLPSLPDTPVLRYTPHDGSLSFRYIPTWPQLRPVWCSSIGDTTIWRCEEHII